MPFRYASGFPNEVWTPSGLPVTPWHFWVSSVAADNGADNPNNGVSQDAPWATINYAVERLQAESWTSKGAIIHVASGHTETVSGADGIDCDVEGLAIVGHGFANNRPTITFTTATAADVEIAAANVRLQNLIFVCNIASQVAMVNVAATGDGAQIIDCEFREGSATGLSMLVLADADDVIVDNCRFFAPTAGNYDEAIHINAALDRLVIRNCYVRGDFDDACVHNPTGNVATNLLIENNTLIQLQSGDHAIELVSACTGVYRGNSLVTNAAATAIDPGSMSDGGGNTWGSTSADEGAAPLNPVPDSASNILGADDSNNLFASTNVARNADGSIIERLEDLKADLSGTAGIATFPAAAEAANAVSLAEVVRNVSDLQSPRTVLKSTGDLTSFGTSMTLFTVTGDVMCQVFGSVDVAVTCTSGTSTLEVGVAGNTAALCVQDAVDGTAFAVGDSWSLATAADANAAAIDTGWVVIGNGVDIILTGSVDDMTAGDIDFYCRYVPLTAGSSVVAA